METICIEVSFESVAIVTVAWLIGSYLRGFVEVLVDNLKRYLKNR